MNIAKLNQVVSQLDELGRMFSLGQQLMPLVEEVLSFIKEITPLLDDLDASIRVSTQSMPRATTQIASVTQATELATTEILDLVDGMLGQLSRTRTHIKESGAHLASLDESDGRLLALLRTRLQDDPLVAEVAVLIDEKTALRAELAASYRAEETILNEIRTAANQIMLSLQVQDITSQQLAGVSHLIESVRNRLALFEGRLSSSTLEVALAPVPERTTFDANASYDRTGRKQASADAVISSFQTAPSGDGATSAPSSQSDIDDLFAAPPTAPAAPAASQSDIDDLFAAPPTAPAPAASQSDIDNLFAAPPTAPAAPAASQSDIDDLFAAPPTAPAAPAASQSDIDDLFAAPPTAPAPAASQSDIDDLFAAPPTPASSSIATNPVQEDIERWLTGDDGPASTTDIDDIFGKGF